MDNFRMLEEEYSRFGISSKVYEMGCEAESLLKERFERIDAVAELNQLKVLSALKENRVSEADFVRTTGYGYDDGGRDNLENVYISEMLPSKIGWNKPFLEDEIIRGYVDEMRDFIESVYYDREPKSGFWLAHDTIKIIYAAYLSAELGKVVNL